MFGRSEGMKDDIEMEIATLQDQELDLLLEGRSTIRGQCVRDLKLKRIREQLEKLRPKQTTGSHPAKEGK